MDAHFAFGIGSSADSHAWKNYKYAPAKTCDFRVYSPLKIVFLQQNNNKGFWRQRHLSSSYMCTNQSLNLLHVGFNLVPFSQRNKKEKSNEIEINFVFILLE